jgi:hypothetical protein
VTSLFQSNSTHYLGIRLRNYLVPWDLHTSMAGFLAFDSGFSLLTPDWDISKKTLLVKKVKDQHEVDALGGKCL